MNSQYLTPGHQLGQLAGNKRSTDWSTNIWQMWNPHREIFTNISTVAQLQSMQLTL